MPEPSYAPVYTVGRIVQWVVLLVMLVSVLYAGWMSVANWSEIMV